MNWGQFRMNTKERRVSRFLFTLALLPLVLSTGATRAQETLPEPPPVYQIELLAFERPGEVLEEHWPFDPGMPDAGQAMGSLSLPVSGPVTLLTIEEGSLQAAAFSLKQRQMAPLLHLIWQQPVESREQAKGLWVEEERIGGLIKISLGRYLHLDVDLLLTDENTGNNFRVIDHRRMRSEQLNHLDHPKLGILVQITPVKLELIEPPAPTAGTTGTEDIADTAVPTIGEPASVEAGTSPPQ